MTGSGDDPKRRDREERRRRAVILQPVRREIARLLAADGDREAGALELPAGLAGYHLEVLAKHDVTELAADGASSPPLYRWSPRADWARKLLEDGGE
jgi:hypothetical protein